MNEKDEEIGKEKENIMTKAEALLREHFDDWVIIASHRMDSERFGSVYRHGTYFSSLGLVDYLRSKLTKELLNDGERLDEECY